MQKIYFLIAFCLVGAGLWGQSCPECRYVSYVFDSIEVETVKFGEGINAEGDLQELFLDVYQPYGDTFSTRPVMVFAFGGGFLQGSRDEDYVVKACRRFASSGYVAVAIDYRVGFDWLGILPNPAEELMRVFFRAMQDMRGGIQWVRAHAAQMGNTYRVDTNRIFSGGASAGAITALMVSHCDKSSEFAEIGDTSAIASLGGFYSTSGLYPQYSWEVRGVFNIAGALVNADWVEPGDAPIVSAHGDQDAVVPYMGGNLDLGFTSVGLEGSYLVNEAADSVGVCSYLYTMLGEGHPTGGVSDSYIDNIVARTLPRFKAVMEEQRFCCSLGLNVNPNGDGGVTTVSPGDPVNLQAQISNDQGNAQVQWCSLLCGFSSNQANVSVSAQQLPAYFIASASEDSCFATDYTVLDAAVSRADELESSLVKVSPQPFGDQFTIQIEEQKNWELTIYTAEGRLVLQRSEAASVRNLQIQTGTWPTGVYLLRLTAGEKVFTQKLVKM